MSFYVTLDKFVKRHHLEVIYVPEEMTKIRITSKEVNRPGLMLSGYTTHFDPERIQVIGKMEYSYLNSLPHEEKMAKLKALFEMKVTAVVIANNQLISSEVVELARQFAIPLLRSAETTSNFMAAAISFLNVELAQRITRHGVLVEVYGEGVLIIGDSGVGKSETAIELVKRGHRLIADDAVEIRKVSNHTLVGQAPENIRHFIELRGVGIINIARAYGSGAVKNTQGIDMVIELENWNPEKNYSTTGLNDEYMDILGISVIKSTVPVRPGRNLSIIIETAAITNRQKKMGYNPARELLSQLGVEE
ncbi:MAG: HPr(Ser) kinase/phosphatase [Oscillospiraceae bacterium]|nr:HPr(Ser) kinase/phosphatase [Oscillospiraceae bacterium]